MKKFLVICSLLFLASAQVFALEVVNNRSEILLKEGISYNKGVEEIQFYEVLKAAIDNSYDIDSALVNIEISKQQLKSAKREYIPVLNLRLNTEYAKGLGNNAYGIYSIGDTIINENTKYQDAATVSLQHTLIDYGAKKYKVNIAKNDIEQKEILYYQNIRDLKIKILDIYTRVLSDYLQIEECKYQAKIYDEIYSMQKRLYEAGLIGNIEVKSAKAQKLSAQAAQENLKIDFYENLAELSFYTNQDYGAESLRVGVFKFLNNEVDLNEFDFKKSPEYLAYQKEIEKKKNELSVLKAQRLPSVAFYSNYSFYGSNKDNYSKALKDLDRSNFSLGLSTTLPLAEQYKQLPKIKEAELQIRNLEIEQAKQSASFYKEFNKARYLISVYGRQKLKNEDLTKTYDEKLVMVQRLDSSKLIAKTELLKEMIENHKQKTDFLILEQKTVSSIEKIKFLTEQDDDTKRFCRI